MTIVESIKKVLSEENKPLSHKMIYDKIISSGLYDFGAKDPVSVVRSKIRIHCYGMDFPSSSPKKLFIESAVKGRSSKPLYELWDGTQSIIPGKSVDKQEALVEEVIHQKYKEHIKSVKTQLLDCIRASDPAFFERLVVELLLKMGYGWDEKLSGRVVGGAGDGGIDGIISEDKLGLENIYVQAKRYSGNNVPPNEIRDFIGAMVIHGARKGVFFSSSDFSEQGVDYASKAQHMNVTLVNGQELCDLLVQHQMGIAKVGEYTIYSVDKNFFNDD
ncbi:MAG: restriction endonuclease [Pseudomonadales bacterium]